MAKRYADYVCINSIYNGEFSPEGYDFRNLEEVKGLDLNCLEKAFRFRGTLGQHCFILTPVEEGYKVTGVDTRGQETGSTIITEHHTLGYDCGEVWRILQPEYIKDPLKRLLAQFKLAKTRINWVDKDFIWLWNMDYTRIEQPGYVSFSSGEKPDKYCKFGFSTIHHIYDGSVNQRYKMGNFYLIKGTPKSKVVQFIRAVMNNDHENPVFVEREKCQIGTKCAFTTHHDPSTKSYEVSE